MGIFASKRTSNKANIVLVHGFWADGSGWSKVIPTLQAQDHFVVAGQHAHTSLADDVAATRQLLAELEGPHDPSRSASLDGAAQQGHGA
jgi:pimeloyl-ACP methyl ester carboxylesterase